MDNKRLPKPKFGRKKSQKAAKPGGEQPAAGPRLGHSHRPNRATFLLGPAVQAKLSVGRANNQFEQEAETAADQATSGESVSPITPLPATGLSASDQVQMMPTDEPEEDAAIQAKSGGVSPKAAAGGKTLAQAVGRPGPGQPLDTGLRQRLGPAFGSNFQSVRVHHDGQARQTADSLGAKAFTHRNHIWLGSGQSPTNKRLLAHELTHVVQQQGLRGHAPVMRDVDEKHYYTDRGGAVARGRELQQQYTDIEVFQRGDKNWQVRYDEAVPQVTAFPAVDKGKFYKDQPGAEARAQLLRAYGYVVEVFQRTDGNWQCRMTKIATASGKPELPTAIGADAGHYYALKESAARRAEALEKAGFTVKVGQRQDKNWQVEIIALPTYASGKTAVSTPPPAKKPATTKPAKPAPKPKAAPAAKAAAKAGGPPHKLVVVNTTDPAKKKLNDAVAQSFRDFAKEVKDLTGEDLSLNFGDTVRQLKQPTSKVGADTVSWHKTGRAADLNQGLQWVIVENPQGGDMYFKLYLAHKNKDEAESAPEVVKLSKGTKFHHNPYGKGVYKRTLVNVTAVAAKHSWQPIPAQSGWEKQYNKREWWHFERRDGKSWYQALTDIYTEKDIVDGIKSFAKGAAGANKYGARLQREGVPLTILKKIFSPVKKGNLSLLLPVGETQRAANLSDDVKAVQTALIKAKLLTGTASGTYDAATKKAIQDFQKKQGAKKPDGRIDVDGSTHEKLGAVK